MSPEQERRATGRRPAPQGLGIERFTMSPEQELRATGQRPAPQGLGTGGAQ
jgi:hypothetical protein